MLNTLFSGKIDDAEKAKELMKNYDIDVSDTIRFYDVLSGPV